MGCARWKGARLKDVLAVVGLKPDAIEIAFNGADAHRVHPQAAFSVMFCITLLW
jgi:DMSO/TMAO reductase YedYZ molybdopterin-dependent catalytic subunit